MAVSYSAVGSSAGIAAFSAKQADFGASDVPMTAAEQAAAHGGASVQVPVDLGAEAVVYHVILPGGGRLHLTGPVIAQIFLGQITSWNDPAIAALNPGAGLPNAQITVVHRSDGSGTTYIFSNYLSSVDPTWAAKVGTGKTLNWPAGGSRRQPRRRGRRRPHPLRHRLRRKSYSTGPALLDAAIRNQAGHVHHPDVASITAAAAQKPDITPTDFSIVNEPGTDSSPICGYSWALVYTRQASQATGQALVNLLNGYLTEYSLSLDNLFAFWVIMRWFAVPPERQQRVLLAGIVLALVLRISPHRGRVGGRQPFRLAVLPPGRGSAVDRGRA